MAMYFPVDVSTDAKTAYAFRASTREGFGPPWRGQTVHSYQTRHGWTWDAIELAADRLRQRGMPIPVRFKARIAHPLVEAYVPGEGWKTLGYVRELVDPTEPPKR